MDNEYTLKKCRQGVRVAKYKHMYTKERERPCFVLGTVDQIEFWPDMSTLKPHFDLIFYEQMQERKKRFYLN